MNIKVKVALMIAILLWASAFIVMRMQSQHYSPQGMVLLRFMVASVCMVIVYFRMPNRNKMRAQDAVGLMTLGGLSLGVHNLFLNYAAVTELSGVSSFVANQSPIVTAILAAIFLGEGFSIARVIGFIVSVSGTAVMTMGQFGEMKWTAGMMYLIIATLAGSVYSLLQKPFLVRYHAIEATTYVIWGCTLFLLVYFPHLMHDMATASTTSTLSVVYLGIFPVAFAHVAWSYALREIPATQAMNCLYFLPFIVTLLGWICLGEMPYMLTLAGGMLAMFGVMIGNRQWGRV